MPRASTRTVEKIPGPVSLFRHKLRQPVTMTLTPRHHTMIKRAMKRTGLTRADVVALLIERFANDLNMADVYLYKPVADDDDDTDED